MTPTIERPVRPPKPRSLKAVRNEADELAACAIKLVGRCAAKGFVGTDGMAVKCSERLEWAHVKSRGILFLRHDPRNAACLCSAHHKAFTLHPDHWFVFIRDERPGTWDYLNGEIRERRATKVKAPLMDVYLGWIEHYRAIIPGAAMAKRGHRRPGGA